MMTLLWRMKERAGHVAELKFPSLTLPEPGGKPGRSRSRACTLVELDQYSRLTSPC